MSNHEIETIGVFFCASQKSKQTH